MQKVSAHILAFCEEKIIPYSVRHYKTFCHSVTVHDLGSTDQTRELAIKEGATIRQWDCKSQTDDVLNAHIKNTCWANDDSDWCICADADELVWFPAGPEIVLDEYENQQLAIIKPHGFEMTSNVFPTTKGQIYEEVKFGARDDHWYAKPILFSKRRVSITQIGMGAHEVSVTLKDGGQIYVGQGSEPSFPPTYMLHYHHISSVEEVGVGYEGIIRRHGEMNRKMGWGVQANGKAHAQEKRAYIQARLEKVIP